MPKSGTPAYVTSKIAGHASVYFTATAYQHADDAMVDLAAASLETALGE